MTAARVALLATVQATLVVVGLELAVVASGAGILWCTAGSTVYEGTAVGQVLTVAVGTVLVVLRQRVPRGGDAVGRAGHLALLVARAVVAVALVTSLPTGGYFGRWVVTYAATLLLGAGVGLVLQSCVRPGESSWAAALGTVLLAVSLLVLCQDVHHWHLRLLSGGLVLATGYVLIGAVATNWLRRGSRLHLGITQTRPQIRNTEPQGAHHAHR